MDKENRLLAVICMCLVFAACNVNNKGPRLVFEPISDSLYKPNDKYEQDLLQWKNYYQQCMNKELFPDAFYLQLQDKIYIGSINNENELDVNKEIRLLDTSNNKNIFDLMSVINASNCSDTITLTNDLRTGFYKELSTALNAAPGYKYLTAVIDTVQMKIKIATMGNTAIMPDVLINILDTTKDSSLIRFKELLLKPENVLLAQTVEVLGFSAEFPLKSRLSSAEEKQLAKEVFFNINSNDNGSIILLSNNNLLIRINKRYTVLGRFLKLKAI